VLGFAFSSAVDDVLDWLSRFGSFSGVVVLSLIALYVAYRWYRRRAFIRRLRTERITVHELRALIEADAAPVILDVRAQGARSRDGAIPNSISIAAAAEVSPSVIAAAEVIVYCACPNEASAATIALQLLRRGARRVRPLFGGIDAWVAAGFEVRFIE